MKKLSEIVGFAKGIQDLSLDKSRHQLDNELTNIIGKLKNYGADYVDLADHGKKLLAEIDNFNQRFSEYKDSVLYDVTAQEKEYFIKSYDLYEGMKHDSDQYMLERKNPLTVDNTEEYQKRIGLYTSWKVPALYISPKTSTIVKDLVACNPLYIADQSYGLLEPVKKLWSEQYNSRIRYNVINDESTPIFKELPVNQFGLIVATEFFNFKPLEVIQKYIEEFFNLLRPGGVAMFTYNNCDLPGPVRNVENSFNTYTPGRLLYRIIEGIGFEILYANQSPNGYNWVEFKKPGQITTLKGGQALAQIKDSRLDN